MKPGRHLDERTDAPAHGRLPFCRPENLRQQLQNRGLARAVRPDDRQRFAGARLEADVLDGPELLGAQRGGVRPQAALDERGQQVAEAVVTLAAPEFLPDSIERHRRLCVKDSRQIRTRQDESATS